MSYDEYGQGSPTQIFGYTGQMRLYDTSLYHYKARTYAPALGRFLQTDPIGYEAGLNLYAYVGNDPVNRSDPTGECPICLPLGVGAIVGGGLEAVRQYREYGEVRYVGRVVIMAGVGASSAVFGAGVGSVVTGVISGGATAGSAAIVGGAIGGATGGAAGGAVGSGVTAGLQARGEGADLQGTLSAGAEGAGQGAIAGAITGGIVGAAGPSASSAPFSRPVGSNGIIQVMPNRIGSTAGSVAGEVFEASPDVASEMCWVPAGEAITVGYAC